MPELHRKVKPGRYGSHPVFASAAVAATSSATVNTVVPIPTVACYVSKATVTLSTLGVSASGTILLKLQAVATNGTTVRDLTATALSLESDGVATALVPVDLTITATPANRVIKRGETLRLNVVSDNTNGTAPVGGVALELFVLE